MNLEFGLAKDGGVLPGSRCARGMDNHEPVELACTGLFHGPE